MLRSFRFQLTVAFGLGVLVLASLLSAVLGELASRSAMRSQSAALQALARSTSVVLAEGLHERLREVELLAGAPMSVDLADWNPLLQHMQQSSRLYSWVGLADPGGKVLHATNGTLVGVKVGERPWFKAALAGPHVGDVHTAKLLAKLLPPSATGEPLRFVDFAAPIRDRRGEVRAVLGVHMNWDWAHEVVGNLRSPAARAQGVLVFILDRAGKVIHRPVGDASTAPDLTLLGNDAARIVDWAEGSPYLTAAARAPARRPEADLGWTVVVRQPLDHATAPAREARNTALGMGAVAALLSAALAWATAGRMARPLSRIAAFARRVQDGQLQAPFPTPSGIAEVQQLACALSDMTTTLRQREADLADANTELENRVRERTAELRSTALALRQANADLERLATRDALTGLLNRRGLEHALRTEFARHRRSGRAFALVLADVDHFKRINDEHGHDAGDEVLASIAQALQKSCRASDIVGRYGGEEFLLLMPETPHEGAVVACEKLRAAIAALPGRVPVSMSFGIVPRAADFGVAEQALKAADQALYRAKAEGRNRCCVHDALGEQPG